jgi:acyl transferase domain-containing protein
MSNSNDVAIIGMAGVFPEADTVEKFWENIYLKKESIRIFSDDYLRKIGVDIKDLEDPNYVKAGTFLKGTKEFDAEFFGYTPREAEIMDPQQRKFLEMAWSAYENAGYATDSKNEYRVGVFAGCTMNTYILQNLIKRPDILNFLGYQQIMIGNDKDFITSRVSYKMNLTGPSIGVQTACSSSLYAIHLAYQSLLIGDCDMALAGGSSIRFPMGRGYIYNPGGTSSKDGHCYTFDKRANGSVVGSGTGVVVLKRLDDAIKDNDTILAVIKSTSIGNDGADKAGFSAPSISGQEKVIADAFTQAEINPESIQYVEAHGTATQLGDPIEFAALTNAFNKFSTKKNYCAIGSVKTNIGHLDAAAGVAGLIKIVLALQNKKIPSNSNFETPNENINLMDSPFYINNEPLDWENKDCRRAAINSIGMGGNDAFIILEEAPKKREKIIDKKYNLFTLSAKTKNALKVYQNNIRDFLMKHHEISETDMAYTFQIGRNSFKNRIAYVYDDKDDLIQQLSKNEDIQQSLKSNAIFIFGGTGSQYINMCQELYTNSIVFKEVLENTNSRIKNIVNLNLLEDIFRYDCGSLKEKQKINEIKYADLSLFLVEYSLAEFLINLGIQPKAILGEGVGELVAGIFSGLINFEETIKLLNLKIKYLDYSDSVILKVCIKQDVLSEFLNEDVKLVSSYSDSLHILKGSNQKMFQMENALSGINIKCERLYNFPTLLNDSKLNSYFDELINLMKISENEKTKLISGNKDSKNIYQLINGLRTNNNFVNTIKRLKQFTNESDCLVMIGHDKNIEQALKDENINNNLVSVLNGNPEENYSQFLKFIGYLWSSGFEVNWNEFWKKENVSRIPLPTYPFSKTVFWVDQDPEKKLDISNVNETLSSDPTKSLESSYEESQIKKKNLNSNNKKKRLTKDELQKGLLRIWKEATGIETLGIKDDLFELGGDSLMATQIISEIRKKYDVTISIGEMFENASVEYITEKLVNDVTLNKEEKKSAEKDIDEKMKYETLKEIDSLTDEEVIKLLQEGEKN